MKLEVVLKPCPWCRKTPDLFMPIAETTWVWTIRCINQNCCMKPVSPHISIRKTTKENFFAFHGKIEHLANTWNGGNPFPAFEMKLIDLEKIPDLNRTAQQLCDKDPWFKRIQAI